MDLQPHRKKYAKLSQFLNRIRDTFEWENDNTPMTGVTGEEVPVVHPLLIAEIPGVVLKEDYDDIVKAITETPDPTDEGCANAARKNEGLYNSTGVASEITGV